MTPAEPPLSLAKQFAARGWHVLPLSPTSKRPLANCSQCQITGATHRIETCPCLPRGRWCHGVRTATTDAERLTAWWQRQPDAVPGIAAGPSGLVLIDLDAHDEELPQHPATELVPGHDLSSTGINWSSVITGMHTLVVLAQLHGGPEPWPADPAHQPLVVATPSGGRHLWYQAPANGLRQAIGELGWQIDIKAGWNYGIAPGATTGAGTYRVLSGTHAAPGQMPDWLAREVVRVASTRPRHHPHATRPADRSRTTAANYLTTVISRGATRLTGLTDGRQRALAALAYQAGGLLTWSGLPESHVVSWLITAGEASGLPTRVATRIVRRALANGMRQPLQGPARSLRGSAAHA
ncbi:bifunctional DNA primase/polymerase [Streptosporangiaceae bacterium NEAU-GS5]|nr:bifunctional DNA primase/polymerase [Streptosporangiaceae bacterium NEAU-GS5]